MPFPFWISAWDRLTEDSVRKTAGLADKTHLFAITDAILSKDAAKAVEIADELHKQSKDMARLCEELVGHFRAIMLIKTVKNPRESIVMSESDFIRTERQAQNLSLPFVIKIMDTLQSAKERMLQGVNRRVEMEMTMVKLCGVQSESYANPELEKRLAALEKLVAGMKANPPVMQNTPVKTVPPPIKKPSVDMAELRKNAVKFDEWQKVVEQLRQYSRSLGTSFDGSTAYISGKYILVDSKNDMCFELLRKPEHRTQVRDMIQHITGKVYSLGRYSYPDEQKPDDPLIQLVSDFKAAGIPVEDKEKNSN